MIWPRDWSSDVCSSDLTLFVALAGTNDDLLPSEVDILYAQRERFGETQSRAIEQRCDQIRFSAQMAEERRNLLPSQDDRYVSAALDRKSTRLNSSHVAISYAVFCLKKKI